MKRTVFIILMMFYCCIAAYSQSLIVLDSLQYKYTQGELDRNSYMEQVGVLIENNLVNGQYFESTDLLNYLQLYRKMAWSNDDCQSYRTKYYSLLANNARMQNRGGEALYYYEKLEKEQKKQGVFKPVQVLTQKCYLHTKNKSFRKAIEAYEQEVHYFQQTPALLQNGTIKKDEAIEAIYVLSTVASSYAYLGDTAATIKTIELSERISSEIFKYTSPHSKDGTIVRFLISGMHFFKNKILLKDMKLVKNTLSDLQEIIYSPSELPQEWRGMLEKNYADWASDYYLHIKQNDSAAFYISRMSAAPNVGFEHQQRLNEYKAWLAANRGEYESVHPIMVQVLEQKDSITSNIMNDMDELLYAYTQAENDRKDLIIAEDEKKSRNIIILVISILSLLVIGLIYRWAKRKERESKRKIAVLNRMANLQIAEIEEIKLQERQGEQQRLGRELHDNLSSSVASVKYRLEKLARDENMPELQLIHNQVSHIYDTVRNKSHQWSWESSLDTGKSFEDRIKSLVNATLPAPSYSQKISIDDEAVAGLTIEDKIQLLRIIQEAITNILKHAKASEIDILLYKEDEQLVLIVGDNGTGFQVPVQQEKSLGISSMQSRAAQLNGILTIDSDNSGTRMKVVMKAEEE